MEIITQSAQDTQNLGEKFANNLDFGKLSSRKGAVVICLYGDLGSGKTTFIQGLAKGLGIEKRILSPTFIIMRQYPLAMSHLPSIMNFYHADLYRIESIRDLETIGLKEIWSDPNNIIALEWPEKIENHLPATCIKIKFEYIDENSRKITIF